MPVLRNISQLAVCPPGNPQDDAGLVSQAALAWSDGTVRWTGPYEELPAEFAGDAVTDCAGRLVVPGLVDCHTHLCFGGWRGDEFEARLRGASYRDIAAAGGGITRTVTATRGASLGELQRKAHAALQAILRLGVTTLECKSGYGLDEASELKQLEVYRRLDAAQPIDLVPTFLGAHVVPPEHREHRERYIDLLSSVLIPRIAHEGLARFCDVFVEEGAFSVAEARTILRAARDHGLGLKVHAEQLSAGGGALLAAEMGAVSAEHLEYADDAAIEALAAAGTVAVSLPLASLYLGERYLPARRMLAAGLKIAVATDFNPGSAPTFHLPLAMTLACLNQSMTPQEVLMGATTVAARAVAQHDRVGSLLPGYQADLAIIDAPSLNQWLYHFVPNACVAVLKDGQWVS
jgi:imidazolonepropionase